MTKKAKKPWPTKDAMNQIYELNLWGGSEFDFYSGSGSHNPDIVNPYLDVLTAFLESHNKNLTVCDLGCGDFNIGKQLTQFTKKYIAIDIVENLIERNKQIHQANNLEFHCLDIAKDELPMSDCIIVRQVLQHLSNAEIKNVVEKLTNYKYIILTEHLPLGDFKPNKDIISGQGIRLKQNSGVNLLEAPFNLKIKTETILGEYNLEQHKGRIVTKLLEMF
ncbi:class I SAM-dependent methyltransferase [Algibacter lectus]|uniref:Methyltransferase family protein n=1 Tax=Algibacter lectus TaxID=221126 RepID=A0A090V880_9FLAO|nr:class I SAM-dependent methyltransferase [Algibacter lectus]TDY62016.1 methyltransferase family protein [Algibacter lectus]GAL61011.1 Mll0579 protein [Algibacter lectus]SFC81346.1 Methyltransferase domain-containing protein [Algibacter lectus]